MSHTAIHTIDSDGNICAFKEYRNAHGGVARIWDALYDKYLKDPTNSHDHWGNLFNKDNEKRLWNLWKDETIPKCARIVLIASFDYAVILKEFLAEYVDYLEEFEKLFPRDEKYVNHLPAWIEDCRELSKDESVHGICFYGTSIGEDWWFPYDDEKEENVPYNINTGKEHSIVDNGSLDHAKKK